MANQITTRSDIARAMYLGTKEVFMDNLKKQPNEQWKAYATVKNSDKMEETYDSVGNLKPAEVKPEGNSFDYGKIEQAYKTVVKNETVVNGFSVTMEAKEDEKWGVVPEVKVNELIRTMISKREQSVAAVWDGVTSTISADGKAYAATDHPLVNNNSVVNNNLVDKAFELGTYREAVNKFNHWYNHYGDKFFTTPSAILAHRDRQTYIFAMLQSQLLPFEESNTKNTIPQLKTIFSSYINSLQVHILDESIDSAIFQQRKNFVHDYDYDNRSTFNFYYNVHERYKAAMINPGFGFVTITGVIVPVTSVALDESTLAVDVEGTGDLVATIAPANASDQRVIWTSSDPGKAIVIPNTKNPLKATIKGVAAGTTTITVYAANGNKSDTCTVTVSSE